MMDPHRTIITARTIGTAALLLFIPTLNLFAVIAYVLCWAGSGGDKKQLVRRSGLFYGIAAAWSVIAAIASACITSVMADVPSFIRTIPLIACIICAVLSVVLCIIEMSAAGRISADEKFFE